MDKNYALITGGSSGIGFEIARDLAKRGYNIILVSRNEQNLQDSCKHLSEREIISEMMIPRREPWKGGRGCDEGGNGQFCPWDPWNPWNQSMGSMESINSANSRIP